MENNAVFPSENSLMIDDMGILGEEGRVTETSPNTDIVVCT